MKSNKILGKNLLMNFKGKIKGRETNTMISCGEYYKGEYYKGEYYKGEYF